VVHVDTNNVVRVAVVAIIVLVTLIFAPRKKEHGKYLKNPKTSRTNEQTCQRKKIITKKKRFERMYRTARLVPCTTLQKTCEGAREASKQARKKLFFDLFYRTSLKTIGHMRERKKKNY